MSDEWMSKGDELMVAIQMKLAYSLRDLLSRIEILELHCGLALFPVPTDWDLPENYDVTVASLKRRLTRLEEVTERSCN